MALSAGGPAGVCWVVSDGRRGIESQALGLAEAVAAILPLALRVIRLPRGPVAEARRALAGLGVGARGGPAAAADEAPILWIGCGRAALAEAAGMRARFPRAFFVCAQDPRAAAATFDLIIPPRHDEVAAANAFPILGSPNRITPARLAEAAQAFRDPIAALPAPRAAVLVGGASKRHRLARARATAIADDLARLADQGCGLMVTTSRRTPAAAAEAIAERLAGRANVWLWRSQADGPNPYFAFLAAADVVLATKDSTNMLTEAASAGKPVLLLEVEGRDGKFAKLYDALAAGGWLRPFRGAVEVWRVPALAETARAGAEIARRLALFTAGRGASQGDD